MNPWLIPILSAVAGLVLVQYLPTLPHGAGLIACVLFGMGFCFFKRSRWLGCFLLGLAYASFMAHQHLADRLDLNNDNKVARLTVQVTSLASYGIDSVQFEARRLHSRPSQGIPTQLKVRWYLGGFKGPYEKPTPPSQPLPQVRPGQVWTLTATLRRPYGLYNPGQMDSEYYYLAQNVRAIATVKGHPVLVEERAWDSLGIVVERVRHAVRAKLQTYLVGKRFSGVMTALVMGDQQGIGQDDWVLFNRTGITHLVSISGSHITMLSALGSLGLFWAWRFSRFRGKPLSDRFPAHPVAGLAGILIAALYCCLAGWGVPAQRTFLMLMVFYLSYIFSWQWSVVMTLAVSALVILLRDPWAVQSVGFWLSFGAMVILISLSQAVMQAKGWWGKLKVLVITWTKTQGAIFIVMTPLLVFWFSQVSLVSPLVNAYAIFVIGALVTPLCLLLAVFSWIDFLSPITQAIADFTHFLLTHCMQLTQWLSQLPWALVDIPAPSFFWVTFVFIILLLWLFNPYNRWLYLGFVCLVPLYFGVPKLSIEKGDWQALALDIGQGASILVQTQHHTLLFDTGVRTRYDQESANQVILPVLRHLGIHRLDQVVVSHSDLDHVGGFNELISQLWVDELKASFRLDHWLSFEEKKLSKQYLPRNPWVTFSACHAGDSFEWDGVQFTFLWPDTDPLNLKDKSTNAQSCVLEVRGKRYSLLLTGDITQESEAQIVKKGLPHYDVLMVPHHGSNGSSSPAFIQATSPKQVIAQAGHYNRFGHPRDKVIQRWQAQGTVFWDTIHKGAIWVNAQPFGLSYRSERDHASRYWLPYE